MLSHALNSKKYFNKQKLLQLFGIAVPTFVKTSVGKLGCRLAHNFIFAVSKKKGDVK
jgi:hypothetical protein